MLKDILKSKEQITKELIAKEKEYFFSMQFNEKIKAYDTNDLEMLILSSGDIKKNYKEICLKINTCKKTNFKIKNSLQILNNSVENEKDLEIIKSIIEFKNRFNNEDELLLNFDDHFKNHVEKLNRYIDAQHLIIETKEKIEKFNLYVKPHQKLVMTDNELKVDLSNFDDEDKNKSLELIQKYIKIINYLNDFIENGCHLPYAERFTEFSDFWIDKYKNLYYENFDYNIINKYIDDKKIFEELKYISRNIDEYKNDNRKRLNELIARVETNKLLENMFKTEISELEQNYKDIILNYNNQKNSYQEIIERHLFLKEDIINLDKKYMSLLSPIKNTINMLGISDNEDIQDINDYYIYSLSKNIERKMNAYGTSKSISIEETQSLINKIEEKLYRLTDDQKNAIFKSVEYLNENYTANCLIQGDVSSGKTIVTVALMFIMAKKKMKSLYIVPRRVLRLQHLATLKKYNDLFNLNLNIHDSSEEFDIKKADIILNGYSFNNKMFSEVSFDLGVIDEIQLFGVEQRNQVQKKYHNIDMFYTTATPHPRTKLISLVGNMDVIEIREMPPGRKLKNTIPFTNITEEHIKRVEEEAKKGNMTLVVCPLVKKQGLTEFESLPTAYLKYKELFPNLNVQQLRAEYSDDKKENIIECAIKGEIDILIATKSIEVGIDIPRASVIFIHYPHIMKIKWGVSQLHQLRGRIGRNNQDSYCYIETPGKFDEKSPIGSVLKTQDVFELTKNDFNWRGFEKIIGTKQSGGSGRKSNQEKRIKAYEIIAKKTPELIENLNEEFLKKLEEQLNSSRVENLN